jgi:hypothetical protein
MHQNLTNTSGQQGARGAFWNLLCRVVVGGQQSWWRLKGLDG